MTQRCKGQISQIQAGSENHYHVILATHNKVKELGLIPNDSKYLKESLAYLIFLDVEEFLDQLGTPGSPFCPLCPNGTSKKRTSL